MRLGNVEAVKEWTERENPSDEIWRRVVRWVLNLSAAPWQEPSTSPTFVEGDPVEVRVAEIRDTGGVEVFYEHRHDNRFVNLLRIAHERPPDSL